VFIIPIDFIRREIDTTSPVTSTGQKLTVLAMGKHHCETAKGGRGNPTPLTDVVNKTTLADIAIFIFLNPRFFAIVRSPRPYSPRNGSAISFYFTLTVM
jgi:hypothetical protein